MKKNPWVWKVYLLQWVIAKINYRSTILDHKNTCAVLAIGQALSLVLKNPRSLNPHDNHMQYILLLFTERKLRHRAIK